MSEPRVSEQDCTTARLLLSDASVPLHVSIPRALAAARQAAEQRAERLEREVRAWRTGDDTLYRVRGGLNPIYNDARSIRTANEALEREDAAHQAARAQAARSASQSAGKEAASL